MKLQILGAGGHAKIVMDAWRSSGGSVVAAYDDDPRLHDSTVLGVKVVGKIDRAIARGGALHLAIGNNRIRAAVATRAGDERFPLVSHASSWISPSATLGPGTLVCAGAIVQAEAHVGRHVIVNSHALVEHDAMIGDFCHIAPGARLGGAVRLGRGVLVGIGAVVLPMVRIGEGAIIGGGAVVVRDIAPGAVVVGNPARPLARVNKGSQ